MGRPRVAPILAVLALATGLASAQTVGGLTVRVFDDKGPLPGATVTISHPQQYVKTSSSLTDVDGEVVLPVLRAGQNYEVLVSFPGYADQRVPGIHVKPSNIEIINVTMIAEMKETVKVIAESEVIDLENPENSTKFSEDFIADLPVPGRFYQNVLTLAPGVNDPDGDGNPIVHGSRSRDFKATVSGVSNVDPLTGQYMSRVNPNSIEEMEVITSGAGVEYGRAQGGFASIVQRQGTNDHEGVFDFYYRSSVLDGTGASDNDARPDPDYDWLQPSVQFSGPIIRDKLWYRLSHELRQIEQPVNVTNGIVTVEQDEGTHDDNITWQVSPRNKLDFQFRYDPSEITNVGVSSSTPAEASERRKRDGTTYSLTWTAPYSPKVLVKSVAAWQDLNTGRFPTVEGVENDCVAGIDFLEGAQCTDFTTGEVSGSFNQSIEDHRQRLTTSSDATFYGGRFWGMNHQFQLGLSIENERYWRHLERSGEIAYFVVNDPAADPSDPNGNQGAFAVADFGFSVPAVSDVRATGTSWALYAEDQIKPRNNITVTVGARIERDEISSEGQLPFDPQAEFDNYEQILDQTGSSTIARQNARNQAFTGYEDMANFTSAVVDLACAGVENPAACRTEIEENLPGASAISRAQNTRRQGNIDLTHTNLAPFLSVAWSPWSNGKTVFRGTARRYYNPIALAVPLTELEPAQSNVAYRVSLGSREAVPDSGVSPAVNVSVVDRDLDTPYQDEFTLTVERELWTETRLRVSYINRSYRDQIQDVNINRTTADYGRCVYATGPEDSGMAESLGSGQELVDPFTGESYIDTDPGGGDGRLDDCIGEIETINLNPDQQDPFGRDIRGLVRPDGIADLYVLNPYWGDIYLVGNFNEADYDAIETELVRRQYRGWEMSGSYVWSKSKGNGEDFFQEIGDDPSLLDDESGYQSTDQRHVVKLAATTITPWGIRLGTSTSWQSGLPFSLLRRKFSYTAIPPSLQDAANAPQRTRLTYLTGTRNDQRNDSYWLVDVRATKELNLGRGMNMQLAAEIYNLFNDDTYLVYNPAFEFGQQVNGNNDAIRLFGRQWQLGLKLSF